jgi:hypothetical protein
MARLPKFYHIRLGPVPRGRKCFVVKDVGRPGFMKITAIYTPPKSMSCPESIRKKAGEFEYIQKAMIARGAWEDPKEREKYEKYFRKKHKCTPKQMPGRSRFELICER